MAFQPAPELGTLAETGLIEGLDLMQLIQMVVLAAVILVLALFVLRPMLVARRAAEPVLDSSPVMALPGPAGPGGPAEGFGGRVLTGEIDERGSLALLPIVSQDGSGPDLPEEPVARLRRLIEERQAESLEILRGWMEDREEKA
jgi:flagellar M-ring protein FliF